MINSATARPPACPVPPVAATDELVRRAGTIEADGDRAVDALYEQMAGIDAGLYTVFCAPGYDYDRVAARLAKRFGDDAPLIGCTTSGVISPLGYRSDGMSMAAISSSAVTTEICTLSDIQNQRSAVTREQVQAMRFTLEHRTGAPATEINTFGFMLIDGLQLCEERVISAVAATLGGLPLVGGSAGDDFTFRNAGVFHRGRYQTNAATLALVHSKLPFKTFSTHHFEAIETKMVVTHAEPARRLVLEINGEPAAAELARICGVPPGQLDESLWSHLQPAIRVGDSLYLRSIIRPTSDGALLFACAIDTGVVLRLARARDMVEDLDNALHHLETDLGPLSLVLGCDCSYRQVEMERRGLTPQISELMLRHSMTGFSSFGEQINSMHLNQTMTGVALASRPRDV